MYLSALSSRLRVWLAPILALALVAGGLFAGSVPAFAASAPSVTITSTVPLDPAVANTVTVKGTGFEGPGAANGVYVLFGETSSWSGGSALPGEGWITQGWVQPRQISNGSFTTTIAVPAGTLNSAKTYQVATSAAHALSGTDRTMDTFTPVAVQQPAPVVPKVTVSKTTGLNRSGETIVVTGTGFVPNTTDPANSTTGARPPLAGKFAGAYVTFGKFADVWKASEGAPTSARKVLNGQQKWAIHQENFADLDALSPGASASAVAVDAAGNFRAELTVSADEASDALAGNYGIYTYPSGKFSGFETATPVSFAPVVVEPVVPKVTVSKTTGLNRSGETIVVTGTGFVPNTTDPANSTTGARPPLAGKFAGAYVTFGKFADVWKASEGAPTSARKVLNGQQKWAIHQENFADLDALSPGASASAVAVDAAGNFRAELTVSADEASDALAGNYGIYTYPSGKFSGFETATPVSFAPVVVEP
ncbi:hypothetical protein D9V32_12945, partial [Mycetocola tolaasinivorans]